VLERNDDGRYVGTVTVPDTGAWRFTIVSGFPLGTTELAVDVGATTGGDGVAALLLTAAVAAVAVAFAVVMHRRRPRGVDGCTRRAAGDGGDGQP
jgi:hypothetical protein